MDGKEVWQSFEDEAEVGEETGDNERGKGEGKSGGWQCVFFCSREGFRSQRLTLSGCEAGAREGAKWCASLKFIVFSFYNGVSFFFIVFSPSSSSFRPHPLSPPLRERERARDC